MKQIWSRAWPWFYFLSVALTYFYPVLLGRSSSIVPAMQERLWPWRTDSFQHELGLQLDGAVSSYPWSVSMHNAISRGEFPLWDWNSFSGGYDLSSDGVSGVMYPLHWLVWALFDPALAHDIFMAGHVWLGGVIMFTLLRHWNLGVPASLLGGTAWALAPFNTGWMQAEMITPVLLCTPLAFLTMSRVVRRPSATRVIAASAALALALVAGNLVVFLVLVWLVGLFGLAAVALHGFRLRSVRSTLTPLAALAATAIGAGILSAYSLVPTLLNLMSLGRRTATLQEILPPRGALAPVWHSLWNASLLEDPGSLFALNWCGRVVLVLAIVGLLHRGKLRWVALVLALTFTLLPIMPVLVKIGWYVVPPLRAVSGFGRLTFLATFGLVILSALGFQVLHNALAKALTMRPYRRNTMLHAATALAVMAILVELLPFARAVNPDFLDRSDNPLYPETRSHVALLSAEKPGMWPNLVLPLSLPNTDPTEPWDGSSFWGTTSLVSGIDSVGGYDSAVPHRATSITRVMQGVPLADAITPFSTAFLPTFSLMWSRLDLAAKLGVTHVYVPPDSDLGESAYAGAVSPKMIADTSSGQVFEVSGNNRQPRLVTQADFVTTPEKALEAFIAPDHDPRTSVVLEGTTSEELAAASTASAPYGRVVRSSRGSNFARVSYRSPAASWLVVPIGHDAGWTARVDGRELPIRVADYAFTAVRVPSGDHQVTFSYRPEGFRVASIVSLVGMCAAMLTLFLTGLRRRRRAPAPKSAP